MRSLSFARRRAGFTLIELMIVIAIIGILAAILVPNFAKSRAAAQQSSCCENLRSIATAIVMFEKDNPDTPVGAGKLEIEVQDLIDNGFLKKTPVCPTSGNAYVIAFDEDGMWYVYCPGNVHSAGQDYPRYSGSRGLKEKA